MNEDTKKSVMLHMGTASGHALVFTICRLSLDGPSEMMCGMSVRSGVYSVEVYLTKSDVRKMVQLLDEVDDAL